MIIVIRTDASLEIGTGHVMRCLTLADALTNRGAKCQFICREHPGNSIKRIRDLGYKVDVLPTLGPKGNGPEKSHAPGLSHAEWLGATQQEDSSQCAAILAGINADWLIVDHYALDAGWEATLKQYYRKLMVIDDLADRPHLCDLLLDQNLGRNMIDYANLVPSGCKTLAGPKYALLRPEFAALRPYSLARRVSPQLKHLLITMGGIDKGNATGLVLDTLPGCTLPMDCHITVVMGPHAPWLDSIRDKATEMPWTTDVLADVRDMAKLMADSDLAIGAAGTTAWERCCMGLPTVTVVLAANQLEGARALQSAGAIQLLDNSKPISAELKAKLPLALEPESLADMQRACRAITDGAGAMKLAGELINASA
jgi:UDP-2,4-diacetamido-2,4,6-trideoxy-beta-L-altropyranose hydrolase